MTEPEVVTLLRAVGKLIGRGIPCIDQAPNGEFPLAYVHCEDVNAVREAMEPFHDLIWKDTQAREAADLTQERETE